MHKHIYVSWGLLAAAVSAVFAPHDSWLHDTGYWVFFGSAIASGVYVNVTGIDAAAEHNKNLKMKFAPGLALTMGF